MFTIKLQRPLLGNISGEVDKVEEENKLGDKPSVGISKLTTKGSK